MDNAGGSKPCGKVTCQVCDHIITTNSFTTKACGKVSKTQIGLLNCNSEKVLYILKCTYVGLIIKSKHRYFQKGKQCSKEAFSFTLCQDCIRYS